MTNHRLSIIGVGAVIVFHGAALVSAQPSANSGFVAEVNAGFAQWDRNKDGWLVNAEVEALIANSNVTGQQAAAVAAIQTYQNSPAGQKKPLMREFLLREALAETAKEVRPPFELRFRDGLARIREVNRTLFGGGAPALDGVRQGHIGDCFFVAVVGAVTERERESVRRWIEPQPDRSFKVRFPLGANTTVLPLTDGEIALTSFAGKQGLWINVLEKAFGTIMLAAYPNPTLNVSVDTIAFGGTPVQTIRMMTANEAHVLTIRPQNQTALPSEETMQKMLPSLRSILVECRTNKRIACAGTTPSGNPPDITPKHAFAVLGFDESRDIVRLWNPHGNQFDPQGAAGLVNGYKTRQGRFEMPLDDFARTFCFLAHETGTPIRQ